MKIDLPIPKTGSTWTIIAAAAYWLADRCGLDLTAFVAGAPEFDPATGEAIAAADPSMLVLIALAAALARRLDLVVNRTESMVLPPDPIDVRED